MTRRETDMDRTADHITTAVRSNDSQGYDRAMREVSRYSSSHTQEQTAAYVDGLTRKLEEKNILPRVALFEAKNDFGKIDGTGDGQLQRFEITNFKGQQGVNPLQQRLLDKFQESYGQTRDASHDGWASWLSRGLISDSTVNSLSLGLVGDATVSRNDIDKALGAASKTEQDQLALKNLFQRNENGVSLYDQLKDASGNVPSGALNTFLNNSAGLHLTAQDRASLQLLKDNQSYNQWLNPLSDDFKSSQLQQLAAANGLDMTALQNQPTATRNADGTWKKALIPGVTLKPEEPAPAATDRPPALQRGRAVPASSDRTADQYSDQVKDALTVKSGQSYWQSAEQLLGLAGVKDPTSAQLRSLSKELWIADNRRPAGQLPGGIKLSLSDEIRKREDLAPLFKNS